VKRTICLLCKRSRVVTVCGDQSCRCVAPAVGHVHAGLGTVFGPREHATTVAPCGRSVLVSEQGRWHRELTAAGLAPERGFTPDFTVPAPATEEASA